MNILYKNIAIALAALMVSDQARAAVFRPIGFIDVADFNNLVKNSLPLSSLEFYQKFTDWQGPAVSGYIAAYTQKGAYPTQTCADQKPANTIIQASSIGVLATNDRTYYCGAGSNFTPILLEVECDDCDPAGGQDRNTRFSDQDYFSPRFPFARFYTSDGRSSPVGSGWRSTYHRSVRFDVGANTATVERADGSETLLGKMSSQSSQPAGLPSYVSKDGDQLIAESAGWQFKIATGGVEHFSTNGSLLSTVAKDGYTQTVQMSGGVPVSVSDSADATMQFGYSGNLLSSVQSPAGSSLSFGRDANGNLTSVLRPDGSTRQYAYTPDLGLLQTVFGETGQTYASFTYDSQGLSTGHTAYGDEADGQTTWIYPDGSSAPTPGGPKLPLPVGSQVVRGGVTWRYMYQPGFAVSPAAEYLAYPNPTISHGGAIGLYISQIYKICPSVSCPGLVESRSYDNNGNLSSIQRIGSDGQMHTVSQNSNYDPTRDLPGSETLDGVTATVTWQSQFALPKQIQSPTKTENYTYDTAGNVTGYTVTEPVTKQKYAWTNGYTSGRLTSQTDPGGHSIKLVYDTKGNINTVTLPNSQILTYSGYDTEGRVGQISGTDGSQLGIKYDSLGRVAAKTVNGLTTSYSYGYNATGQIVTVGYPSGQQLAYQYDAQHRLVLLTDADGNTITYGYDALGRVNNKTVQSAQ